MSAQTPLADKNMPKKLVAELAQEYQHEQARRALAYPRLVEALRKTLEVSAYHRSLLSKHGFDKTPVEDDAEALLRSLGESE